MNGIERVVTALRDGELEVEVSGFNGNGEGSLMWSRFVATGTVDDALAAIYDSDGDLDSLEWSCREAGMEVKYVG